MLNTFISLCAISVEVQGQDLHAQVKDVRARGKTQDGIRGGQSMSLRKLTATKAFEVEFNAKTSER